MIEVLMLLKKRSVREGTIVLVNPLRLSIKEPRPGERGVLEPGSRATIPEVITNRLVKETPLGGRKRPSKFLF